MSEAFHPYDQYSREQAAATDFEKLLENFEDANQYREAENRADVLELICSVSIARVRLLERQLAVERLGTDLPPRSAAASRSAAAQERFAQSVLRPRTGNVIAFPTHKPRGAA